MAFRPTLTRSGVNTATAAAAGGGSRISVAASLLGGAVQQSNINYLFFNHLRGATPNEEGPNAAFAAGQQRAAQVVETRYAVAATASPDDAAASPLFAPTTLARAFAADKTVDLASAIDPTQPCLSPAAVPAGAQVWFDETSKELVASHPLQLPIVVGGTTQKTIPRTVLVAAPVGSGSNPEWQLAECELPTSGSGTASRGGVVLVDVPAAGSAAGLGLKPVRVLRSNIDVAVAAARATTHARLTAAGEAVAVLQGLLTLVTTHAKGTCAFGSPLADQAGTQQRIARLSASQFGIESLAMVVGHHHQLHAVAATSAAAANQDDAACLSHVTFAHLQRRLSELASMLNPACVFLPQQSDRSIPSVFRLVRDAHAQLATLGMAHGNTAVGAGRVVLDLTPVAVPPEPNPLSKAVFGSQSHIEQRASVMLPVNLYLQMTSVTVTKEIEALQKALSAPTPFAKMVRASSSAPSAPNSSTTTVASAFGAPLAELTATAATLVRASEAMDASDDGSNYDDVLRANVFAEDATMATQEGMAMADGLLREAGKDAQRAFHHKGDWRGSVTPAVDLPPRKSAKAE